MYIFSPGFSGGEKREKPFFPVDNPISGCYNVAVAGDSRFAKAVNPAEVR